MFVHFFFARYIERVCSAVCVSTIEPYNINFIALTKNLQNFCVIFFSGFVGIAAFICLIRKVIYDWSLYG